MKELHGSSAAHRLFSRRSLLGGAGAGLVASSLSADIQGFAAAIDMSSLQPTSTFAHIAYGLDGGGYWKTSFVFINLDSSAASLTLLTWSTAGTPLSVPVVGGSLDSQHQVTVPANGSVQVDLDETASTGITTGWAGIVVTAGSVRGQGIFKQRIPGRPDFEAVVPMLARTQPSCIIPFPTPQPAVLAMPFDCTGGSVTSVAFANTAITARTLDLEFVDASGASLYVGHESMVAHGQMAFEIAGRYPLVASKKGWMHVLTNASDFTALGFRFNPTGAFTTWLPILA